MCKKYYEEADEIKKIYTREEKKFAGREMSGGYKNDSITRIKTANKKNLYSQYEIYILPVMKFVLGTGLFHVDQCEYGIYVSA